MQPNIFNIIIQEPEETQWGEVFSYTKLEDAVEHVVQAFDRLGSDQLTDPEEKRAYLMDGLTAIAYYENGSYRASIAIIETDLRESVPQGISDES